MHSRITGGDRVGVFEACAIATAADIERDRQFVPIHIRVARHACSAQQIFAGISGVPIGVCAHPGIAIASKIMARDRRFLALMAVHISSTKLHRSIPFEEI